MSREKAPFHFGFIFNQFSSRCWLENPIDEKECPRMFLTGDIKEKIIGNQHFLALCFTDENVCTETTNPCGPCRWLPKRELFSTVSLTSLSPDFQSQGGNDPDQFLWELCGSYHRFLPSPASSTDHRWSGTLSRAQARLITSDWHKEEYTFTKTATLPSQGTEPTLRET